MQPRMNLFNPDLDEVEFLKKVLLNFSRYRR